MTQKLLKEIEETREKWIKTAKERGWYIYPFYIQVWIKDGEIIDSVSFKGMKKDIIINEDKIL